MTCVHNVSDLPEKIVNRISVSEDGHWLWQGYISPKGYGKINFEGANRMAHRVVYTLLVGDIPENLQIDHVCRVRHCVCPAHLETVTTQENTRRGLCGKHQAAKTHCPQGHPLEAGNLAPRTASRSWRQCLTCTRERARIYRAKRRAARLPQPTEVTQ